MPLTQNRPIDVLTGIARKCAVDEPPSCGERRASPRFLLKIPVVCAELNEELQQVSEFIPARTLNVSSGGILLVSPQELSAARISVTFCDWEGTPFELKAEIVHRNRTGANFITGAEFIAID